MSIQLVVFDLDGTLLRTGHRITPEAAAQVAALVADGLPTALASARPEASIAVVNEAIGAPVHHIAYNGARTALTDGTVVREVHFPVSDDLAAALASFAEHGSISLYTDDDRWLAYGVDEGIDREEHDTWTTATSRQSRVTASELAGLNARKIMLEGPGDQIDAVQHAVDGIVGLNLSYSGMNLYDIWPSASGKGNAVAALADALGLGADEVLTVGDSDTDLPMLSWAGTSIGVQPCADSVTDAATELVPGPGSDELFAAVRRIAGLPQR